MDLEYKKKIEFTLCIAYVLSESRSWGGGPQSRHVYLQINLVAKQ